MEIVKSTSVDLDAHMFLYDEATAYQKSLGIFNWIGFDKDVVLNEIVEGKQYKIIIDNEIACVFLLEENDPMIWKERDLEPSIYIHRIATNPKFRGKEFVKHIVNFVKDYAKLKNKLFIRMDTSSGNDKLNNYYFSKGFTFAGETSIKEDKTLPAHYQNNSFTLFEMAIV